MTPYWVVFFCVAVAAFLPRRLPNFQRRGVRLIFGVIFSLFIGFRHEVGSDWYNYARQFYWVADMTFVESVSATKDPAYYPLGWIVYRLGGSIYWLNLVCACLLVAGTFRLAMRQNQPWLALLAAVPYLLIVVGMGYTRQSAAIGCAMIGLVSLADGRVRAFALWVLLGAAFHKSAVLLLPLAAMAATTNRLWTFTWVAATSAIAYWTFVYESSGELVNLYVLSEYAHASQGADIRVAINAVPAIIFILYRHQLSESAAERRLWTIMALGGLVCAALLPLSATATDRLALYFIPLQIYVFGRAVRLGHSGATRAFIAFAIVLYYSMVQFVWLNFSSHAGDWVPYQFADWSLLF